MNIKRRIKWGVGGAVALIGVAGAAYAGIAAATWMRYGRAAAAADDEADPFLDTFMPVYDIAERHHVDVAAPADVTFGALMDMSLEDSALVRAIFKGRQLLTGAGPDAKTNGRSLVEVTQELGWVILADVPGHEIVVGAVTRPWEANVVFRGIQAEQFAAFNEPDYVKIVWTLRSDGIDTFRSIARTETRAVATDSRARRKFRRYWARFSVGIILIRELSLCLVKQEAERRSRGYSRTGSATEIVVPPSGGTAI